VQILLDPGTYEACENQVRFYLWQSLLRKVKFCELDTKTQESVRKYADFVHGAREAKDMKHGPRSFGSWTWGKDGEGDRDAVFCVGLVTPMVHFTMGGVVIDKDARVLSSELGDSEAPIPDLWAAGEITGGIHGAHGLGGSGLLECIVFGGIAGVAATTALMEESEKGVHEATTN
jgi:FAD-dependent fumarate reductase